MGKDFIPLRVNGLPFKRAIQKLLWAKNVTEASQEKYFKAITQEEIKRIIEIELGSYGTNETIFRLDKDEYIVVEGTIR